MNGTWRLLAIGGLAAVACATVTMVTAVAQKSQAPKAKEAPKTMSVEEARKIAGSTKKNPSTPPRTIDDIAKILDQHKPDPAKIAQLKKTADAPLPGSLGGMAKADFLATRGRAARDLGRTQQRLKDLREAYQLAKPIAMRHGPIYVVDFPTPANPSGSPAFQAYINAKVAAKRASMGGGGPGGAGPSGGPGGGVPRCSSGRDSINPGCVGRGGPALGGGGGGPSTMTNLERMPKTSEESRMRFSERVSDEQVRAIRIWTDYVRAETDAGNYRTATAVYEEARPAVITNMTGGVMAMDVGLVNIRLRAGDIEGAKRVVGRVQQLVGVFRQHPFLSPMSNDQTATIEHGLGEIALASGKLAEAEGKFRNSLRLREAAFKDIPRWPSTFPSTVQWETTAAEVRLLLAQSLQRQGKLIEAEVETRRVLLEFLRLQGVDAPRTAQSILILTDIVQAQARYKDAQRLSEIALDIYVRAGVEKAVHADALQRIAVAQASRGRWKEAMATYDKLRAAVANDEVARRRYVDVNLDLALALTRSGQATAAISIFESVVKKRSTEAGDSDYAVAEARGFLGTALAASGRSPEALQIFRTVVPQLVNAADTSAKEEGALDVQNRRQMIVEGYFDLLAQIRGTDVEKRAGIDATDETFRMADVAHAQSLHSAIAASSARAASGQPALAELIRQTQDTDQQIVAIADLLKATLEAPRDQQDSKVLESLRTDVARLKQARLTLRKEIERQFPQYAELINPKPVGIAEARSKLNDDDVLVVTYFSAGRGYAWAIRKNADPVFAPIGLGESEIIGLIDDLLRTVDSNPRSVDEIPPFDVKIAQHLYAAILEPVAAGLRDAKSIIVVPHGTLGRLPFSLLVTKPTPQPPELQGKPLFAGYRDVPFLIREALVSHVPSVAALISLRSVPPGSPNRKPFIGFGDPYFSAEQATEAKQQPDALQVAMRGGGRAIAMRAAPKTGNMSSAELAQLPRLPDTAIEVQDIARVLGADAQSDVILGAKASEQTVRGMRLDDRRVVMFATHGLVPGDLDGLMQPALALASPDVPGVQGDGLLTVEKILGLKLDADWVVLSACNTAAGEGGGAEAVSGLGRAFFYAGARALLVTHWPVETVSARALTTDLFRRQASSDGPGRAAALREAMVEMIDKGERKDEGTKNVIFTYAHPMFWAPFALVGDGRGAR